MSNDSGDGDYPIESPSRWPAADIAASWQRELPGVRTGSIEIITPVWRIAKVLADDRRRTLVGLGVDLSTLDLLSAIRRAGPPYELTTREISRRTLITPGAVSQRVARAEQAGLVARAPSSASRRAVSVRLTEAGHALIQATVRQLLEHEADLIDRLTDAERTALTSLLAKLERALTGLPHDKPTPAIPRRGDMPRTTASQADRPPPNARASRLTSPTEANDNFPGPQDTHQAIQMTESPRTDDTFIEFLQCRWRGSRPGTAREPRTATGLWLLPVTAAGNGADKPAGDCRDL